MTVQSFSPGFLKKAVGAGAIASACLFTTAVSAASVTITASVTGDPASISSTFEQDVNPATGNIIDGAGNPIPLNALPFLNYGDFTVNGGNDLGATTTTIGDGINDETWWVFDFTGDANLAAFSASSDPLVSAILRISLIPGEAPADGAVFVPGLNGAYSLPLTSAVGVEESHVIDLVQPSAVPLGQAHAAADILSLTLSNSTTGPSNVIVAGAGQLPFKYIDDALVTSATLELTRGSTAVVPLPASMPLLLGALAGAFAVSRRRRNA